MTTILKRALRKKLIGWSLCIVSYVLILLTQWIFMRPTFLNYLFTFTTFMVAWSIRGVFQETKDTMLADMGPVELSSLRAHIEQVLKEKP